VTEPEDTTPPEPRDPEPAPENPPGAAMPPGPVLDFYLFEKAKAFQQGGNFVQAEECYRQLLERDPKSLKALNNLGILFETQKRTLEAESFYRRALEIDPNASGVVYNLAHALHVDGRLHDAEQLYRRVTTLDPMSYSAYFNLGQLLQHQQRLEEAELCYGKAAEIVPESTAALSCLGETLYELGRFEEALSVFERSAESDPNAASEQFRLGRTLAALGRFEPAAAAFRAAVALDPASTAARENLVSALLALERRDEAVQVLAEWLFRSPGHAIATHLLAAVSGLEVPARASDAFVRETFDRFAPGYDAMLERLSYRGPVLIGMALAQGGAPPNGDLEVLDAGCGTGLCATVLRSYARRLTGVDLSPGMLARAGRLELYDQLVEREIVGWLAGQAGAFDLIVSADTLSYFGALEPVLAAAAAALTPGGRLVFTIEHLAGGDDADHRLEPTGRYSHAEPYLRRALEAAGLAPRLVLRGVLRHEGGQPVGGLVVLAERKA